MSGNRGENIRNIDRLMIFCLLDKTTTMSGPVVPLTRAFHVACYARYWTVDAVLSNGGLRAPAQKLSPWGAGRRPGCSQTLTFPQRPRVGSVFKISRHLAENRATAGFQRESGLGGDGRFFLVERASATSPKTITFLLKAAPLLGFGRVTDRYIGAI